MKHLSTVTGAFLLLWGGLTWAYTPLMSSISPGEPHGDSLRKLWAEGPASQVAVTVVHQPDQGEIIIRAWFYAAQNRPEEHAQIREAVSFWNGQSDRYVYRLGKGETAIDYAIRFELAAAPGRYGEGGFFIPNVGVNARLLNQVQVVPDSLMARLQARDWDRQVVAYAPPNFIYIAASHSNNLYIGIHEAGHRLGAGHSDGAMNCTLDLVSRRINRHTVRDILASAGIMGRGRVDAHRLGQFRDAPAHVGPPPADFSRAGQIKRR